MNNSVQSFHSVSGPDSDTHSTKIPTGVTTSSAAGIPAGAAAGWIAQGHTVDEQAEADTVHKAAVVFGCAAVADTVHKTAVVFGCAAVADSTPVDIPIAVAGY